MAKSNTVVRVTFRDADDDLCCLVTEKFKSVADAKAAIMCDAETFIDAHSCRSKANAYNGSKRKASIKWLDPNNFDYCQATGGDGAVCYWQYFIEKQP